MILANQSSKGFAMKQFVRKSISHWGMILVDFDEVGWVTVYGRTGYDFKMMKEW